MGNEWMPEQFRVTGRLLRDSLVVFFILDSGFCLLPRLQSSCSWPSCSLCTTGVLRHLRGCCIPLRKTKGNFITCAQNLEYSFQTLSRIRIQTRSCHSSGFPTLLELEGPVGKEMYNHWIRCYNYVCAPWSRAGCPHLKDIAVALWQMMWISSFPFFFFLRIWWGWFLSVGAPNFSVKILQLWNQPSIVFPQYQELLTCG